MDQRLHSMFSVMGLQSPPDAQAHMRERLADVMPAAAVFTEALNYAHHNKLGHHADYGMRTSMDNSPEMVTLSGATPPKGNYDALFRFVHDEMGFKVSVEPQKDLPQLKELYFSINVTPNGVLQFGTQGKDLRYIRTQALASPDQALEFMAAWAERNFPQDTLRRAREWAPKVIAQKLIQSLPPRSNWVGPFAAKAGQLTRV